MAKAARKDFEAEFEALHSEAGHRRKMVDELLKETKAEAERLTGKLAEVEAERDELEHGILRARDIVAAKDAELRKATEKARMMAGEAVAESLRLTEGQIKAAAEEARREAEARLSSQFAADLKLAVEAAAREGKARARRCEVRGDTRSAVDKLEVFATPRAYGKRELEEKLDEAEANAGEALEERHRDRDREV